MTSYLQVATTVESRLQAEEVARHVLDRRLAGCVQILQCASMYHWQGKVETSAEFLCIMKTRKDLFDDLQAEIAAIHPYEVPEILATPVAAGNPAYLDWLNSVLRN
ncbi:MAG TPA: divalent-cation tolerance protein CutA [Desulfobulbus sp.]|nr:divalent-cation tolerance protein CutA [Desulfobulbus sp.]